MSQQKLAEEIFEKLVDVAPESRYRELLKYCPVGSKLHNEVISLLAALEGCGAFLSQPLINDSNNLCILSGDLSGKKIGAYKIDRELGRGGMGLVYLAERVDGEYQQQVAIKFLPNYISSKTQRRFFYRERQLLANLQHQNITRLLDGGTTEDGQPYLVMEYLQGYNIVEYVKISELNLNSILNLFCAVCDAVQYIHSHCIVHCDIKPENIIVTERGIPKLLDFGIARLLSNNGNQSVGIRINRSSIALTPEYSAPELCSKGIINSATDVYSLGILLYRLLSGRQPYTVNAQFPGQLVSYIKSANIEKLSNVSCFTYKNKLKIDLDNIVQKAMHIHSTQRYQSVQELRDDIQRYQVGHAVLATPANWRYLSRKFIGRHLLAVGLSIGLFMTMCGGMVISFWQWSEAQKQGERSQARYEDIREIVKLLVFEFGDALRTLPKSTELRQKVIMRGKEYLDDLVKDHSDDDNLMHEVAMVYNKLATIQGNPIFINLGQTEAAMRNYQLSMDILTQLHEKHKQNSGLKFDIANTYHTLSGLQGSLGEFRLAMNSTAKCVDFLNDVELELTNKLMKIKTLCLLAKAHWHNHLHDPHGSLASMARLEKIFTKLNSGNKALKKYRARYHEILGRANALLGRNVDSLYHLVRYVELAKINEKYNPNVIQLGHAYRSLAKQLASMPVAANALYSFNRAVQIYTNKLKRLPNDIRLRRALAGVNAEIALLYVKLSQQNRNKAKTWIDIACEHFKMSMNYFDLIPDKRIGYGVRHYDVEHPDTIEAQRLQHCVKSG